MKQASGTGKNATGIGMSPIDSKKLIEYAQHGLIPAGSEHAMEEVREAFTRDTGVIGSVPPPSSLKGLAKMALDAVKGNKATVFVDKLGERAAFERTGTRLYEAMLAKYDALGSFDGGPTRERLEEIRDEELEHLAMVEEAILALGGDPTVMTPAADVVGVQGIGLVQVLTDPRTTMDQCLCSLLVAELTDNDGWELLANLAEAMGHTDMAQTFREALDAEETHLDDVRRWIVATVGEVANADVASGSAASPA
jgi:rubrerythrin